MLRMGFKTSDNSRRRSSHSKSVKKTNEYTAASQSPSTSFLFIVNELPTNDNPEDPGSVEPTFRHGRWSPPSCPTGFYQQIPGDIFRWQDGNVSLADDYQWLFGPVGNPNYANGTVFDPANFAQPVYYRAATVFYCNHFDKFFAASGDTGTRYMGQADPIDDWHPLTFRHENNVSYVDHAGEEQYLAVRQATWIDQLLPNAYRCHQHNGPTHGGLAGLLPLVIALVAFSCNTPSDLWKVLLEHRSWRGRQWIRHPLPNGRRERRGMVVSVFTDPENPDSTIQALNDFESGGPIFN